MGVKGGGGPEKAFPAPQGPNSEQEATKAFLNTHKGGVFKFIFHFCVHGVLVCIFARV